MIRTSAFLFDMDGVLIDSTPAVARVWTRWAQERGFNPEEIVRRAHGRPSLTTVRELLPDADHEAENREVERREIEDVEGVVLLPGVKELLDALPSDRWAVVTSSTAPLARVRLRTAGVPTPRFLITSNDVRHGKPDPEPYLKAAALLGVPAHECIVAEDAPAGVRAGKAAGARVLGFRTTVPQTELMAAGADWLVNDCRQLSVLAFDGHQVTVALNEVAPASRRP